MTGKAVARGIGQTIKWLMIGVFALVAVIIVVAIVGLGKAASDADTQSSSVSAHITEIHLGMTRAEVRAIVGAPDSKQHMESGGSSEDLWYYGTLSSKGSYQFVFDNGRLTAKNQY
jgi:hypothetical protein